MVYDINDFDETLPGPFEWDLKRLSASLVIAARHRGFDDEVGSDAVRTATRTYRTKMADLADAGVLDVWYESVDHQEILELLADRIAEGELDTKAAADARKLTEVVDGEVRFREDPPILSRDAMPADPSSCRSRRPDPRSWSSTSGPTRTRLQGGAWSRASA